MTPEDTRKTIGENLTFAGAEAYKLLRTKLQFSFADEKACRVIVPDNQLSLAIGKEGQNAKLVARLTGCKIDIKA